MHSASPFGIRTILKSVSAINANYALLVVNLPEIQQKQKKLIQEKHTYVPVLQDKNRVSNPSMSSLLFIDGLQNDYI